MKNHPVDGFGPSSVGIGGTTRVVVAANRRSCQETERGLRIDPRDTMTVAPRQNPLSANPSLPSPQRQEQTPPFPPFPLGRKGRGFRGARGTGRGVCRAALGWRDPQPPSGGGDRCREDRGRGRSEGAVQRSWAEKLNRRSRGGDQGGRKDADEAGDRSWTRTTRKLTNN